MKKNTKPRKKENNKTARKRKAKTTIKDQEMLKIEKYQKGYECMKNGENAHWRHTFSHGHPFKNYSKQIVLQYMH